MIDRYFPSFKSNNKVPLLSIRYMIEKNSNKETFKILSKARFSEIEKKKTFLTPLTSNEFSSNFSLNNKAYSERNYSNKLYRATKQKKSNLNSMYRFLIT